MKYLIISYDDFGAVFAKSEIKDIFEGTRAEAEDYAYSLIREILPNEDLDGIKRIIRNTDSKENKVWELHRTDHSVVVCWVVSIEDYKCKTWANVDRLAREFVIDNPNGISLDDLDYYG